MGRVDSLVILWDLTEKKLLTTLVGHSMEVLTIAFSEDGILATGSGDGSIRLWDLRGLSRDVTYRNDLLRANATVKQRADSKSSFNSNGSESPATGNIELQVRSAAILTGHAGPVDVGCFLV